MQPIHIQNLQELIQLTGLQDAQHPLIYLSRLEDLPTIPSSFPADYSFGFYTIGLIHDLQGEVLCGRQPYDFQKGTLSFLSPNQLVGHAIEAFEGASGWLLFFEQAYLARSPLAKEIKQYGFFDYAVHEALHLSPREEQMVEQIFGNLAREQATSLDRYSRSVVIANLALLLNYANRFYGRQFITRSDIESDFLLKFDQLLNRRFQTIASESFIMPKAAEFANQLHMTPKYLSDKLKALTGKTAQEHLHFKLLEQAKVLLRRGDLTVAEVAYALDFEYPQYFSRFFKKRVGMSPRTFRALG